MLKIRGLRWYIAIMLMFVTIAFLDLIGAAILWTLIREPKAETPSITA